jgi:hypothetical protein
MSRISRSRLSWSNCFGASSMFFTSGRPTRSNRTFSFPRVSVSATTPTSGAPSKNREQSTSATTVRTFLPSRKIDPGSVNASSPVSIVFNAAGASKKNGSHRGPANARTPAPAPPFSSSTSNETTSPAGVEQRPSCPDPDGSENTQSKTRWSSATPNGARYSDCSRGTSGRTRKR